PAPLFHNETNNHQNQRRHHLHNSLSYNRRTKPSFWQPVHQNTHMPTTNRGPSIRASLSQHQSAGGSQRVHPISHRTLTIFQHPEPQHQFQHNHSHQGNHRRIA